LWGREGKKGGGDECKIEEVPGRGRRRREAERARSGLLCRGDVGEVIKQLIMALNQKRQN
jgi:hypothetical protein